MPPGVASGLPCLGPSFLCSAAFILSIFANSRCYFFRLDPNNPARDTRPGIPEPEQIGLWCYEATNGYYYNIRDFTGDGRYETARAIGTATMAIGFFIWLFYLFAGCKPFPPNAFKFIGLLGVVTCILQSLVFLLNQSSACAGGCSLSTGANCAIAAAVLWFFGGLTSCAAGKDAVGDEEEEEGGGEAAKEVGDEEAAEHEA